jgi:hypothetical protein
MSEPKPTVHEIQSSAGETTVKAFQASEKVVQTQPLCPGEVPPAISQLVELTHHLQSLAVSFGIPFAGLMLAVAGLLWQTGIPKHQRTARGIFASAFVGLIIVIMSDGLVAIITNVLCGGGA